MNESSCFSTGDEVESKDHMGSDLPPYDPDAGLQEAIILVCKLPWPVFLSALGALGINADSFSPFQPPSERVPIMRAAIPFTRRNAAEIRLALRRITEPEDR